MTDEQQIALEQRAHIYCMEMLELLKEVMTEVGSDDFHEKYKNLIQKIEQ